MLIYLTFFLLAADDFDRLEGPALSGISKSADAQAREVLTVADLGTLPNILAGVRTPVVIVKTDEANPARLLISPALRNPPGKKGEPVPILVVERFDTFEAGPATKKLAKGKDTILFDGFRLDLDSGQIVPDGQGGDVQFLATGEVGPRLVALGTAKMFTLKKSPLPPASQASGPSSGRNVLPQDFSGKYRLFANGQTSGSLDLNVNEDNAILGRMRSDQTGGSYKVTGKIATDATNHVLFSIELPRARQEFDGYLFLEGKGAIAGTFTLLDRPYGFFAIREGGSVAPEGEEVGLRQIETPPKFVVEIGPGDRRTVDGKELDDAGITAAMKAVLQVDPTAIPLVRAAPETAFARVSATMALLREAGASSIRIEQKRPAAK